jgi:alcohol dehydrogenase
VRAVVYRDVRSVAVEDVPDPVIEDPADAIVRVTASAICGSDLHFFHGKAPLSPGETIGHEAIGIVTEVGPSVATVSIGDRVVVSFDIACGRCWFCDRGESALCEDFRNLGAGTFGGGLGGAQAELVRVPAADVNLLPVGPDLTDEQALFVGDVLTTGYYGAAISDIAPGDVVAVIGAGPVGFFAVQAALLHEPARVLVLDLEPERLALAASVGAEPINLTRRNAQMAVSEATGGRGADVVIEAVGSVAAFERAVEVVRRGGTVTVLGMYATESVEVQLGVYWARALRIRFAGICPVHAWWREALEAVRAGRIDPLPLISHTLPLDQAAKGYELFDSREATKVVLRP